MLKYILKRLARSLLTLLIIVSIVFILMRKMPITGYFPNYDHMSQEAIANGLHMMGLDLPVHQQLLLFLKGLFTKGSLGISYVYRNQVPVTEILATKWPISVKLGLLGQALALLIGLPLGTVMAQHKGGWIDRFGTGFIVTIQALPAAVYFLLIQLYATEAFRLPLAFTYENPKTWILPVFSLALPNIVYYAMWLRRYMVDESTKDYVKLCQIKGMSSRAIMFKHVFRNAFVPMVQTIPSSLLFTIMGSLYVESIYSVPGMGGLLIDVIQRQDNTMVQALVLIFAAVGIIGLFLGDILMVLVDPRISLTGKEESR